MNIKNTGWMVPICNVFVSLYDSCSMVGPSHQTLDEAAVDYISLLALCCNSLMKGEKY